MIITRNQLVSVVYSGNASVIGDLYQNKLNNRKEIQEFTGKLFEDGVCNVKAESGQKVESRIPRGRSADIPPPLVRKSERIPSKTVDAGFFCNLDDTNKISVCVLKSRSILAYMWKQKFSQERKFNYAKCENVQS